jgi:hypothetical protein
LAVFSSAQAAKLPFNANQKIDPALAEMLDRGLDEKIPVIVMLKANTNDLISDGLTIRYKYKLIPGLAGEATAIAIKTIAKSDLVSGIYYIGSAEGHEYPDLQVGDEVNPHTFFLLF